MSNQVPHYTRCREQYGPGKPWSRATYYRMVARGEITVVKVNGCAFSPETTDEIIHRLGAAKAEVKAAAA